MNHQPGKKQSGRQPEPPADLAKKILSRIEKRGRRTARLKVGIAAAVFGGSVWMVIVGIIDFRAALAQTGFLPIASLLFSDFSAVVANFPDFALSMAESFPVFWAAMVLIGIGFAIWSIAALASEWPKSARRSFSHQ